MTTTVVVGMVASAGGEPGPFDVVHPGMQDPAETQRILDAMATYGMPAATMNDAGLQKLAMDRAGTYWHNTCDIAPPEEQSEEASAAQ